MPERSRSFQVTTQPGPSTFTLRSRPLCRAFAANNRGYPVPADKASVEQKSAIIPGLGKAPLAVRSKCTTRFHNYCLLTDLKKTSVPRPSVINNAFSVYNGRQQWWALLNSTRENRSALPGLAPNQAYKTLKRVSGILFEVKYGEDQGEKMVVPGASEVPGTAGWSSVNALP